MEGRRKYIAYFLVAVSILVLMVSVCPHHHHGNQFCLSARCTVCMQDNCTDAHHHCGEEQGCEHACTFACLTQFHYLTPDWHTHEDVNCDFFTILLPLLSEVIFSFSFDQPADFEGFYLERLHALHLISSVGLRAPPFMMLS